MCNTINISDDSRAGAQRAIAIYGKSIFRALLAEADAAEHGERLAARTAQNQKED